MRNLFTLIFLTAGMGLGAQVYPASNFTLVGTIDPETGFNTGGDKYSGCWGWYQASKNKEYAIACAQAGTYWVDVTAPATPTVSDYEAGVHTACTWREAKTYKNYCYVVSDDWGNNSLQIFDMKYLPDSVHKVYDGKDLFQRGHALWIDGDRLYVSSVTYSTGNFSSMDVYSLANPESPVLLRKLSQDYAFISGVHDMFVRNDTVYASCGYQGLYIFRLTSSNTFVQLGSLTTYTGSGYNHSSALTPDGKTLVFMDEVPSALPVKVADVSNLSNVNVLATINQFPQTTPHNPFMVSNQYCFVSSYEDGMQLYDISNPSAPFLAGYFDTYPQKGGNVGSWNNKYEGQWGCYPFFPSRNIFALDQLNGVFMLKTHLYAAPLNPVGLPDETVAGSAVIFPNPASNEISYSVPAQLVNQSFTIKLLDTDGKTVFTARSDKMDRAGTYQYTLRLNGMAEGIYFMLLEKDDVTFSSSKLVIQH